MKIAIIGSKSMDSLESNLQEAFIYNGHLAEVFDIYDNRIYRTHFSVHAKNLDLLARKYSDKYDLHVFNKIAERVLDYKPDLVIGVYRFIHPNFVKRIKLNGIRIVHINPDALTTFEQQQLFVEAYDVYFTKDPYILRFMRDNMKLNVKLYSESFNVRYHKKPEINKQECEKEVEIDVMTYGTMYPYRVRMLSELLENGINLQVYGVKPHRFYNHVLGASFQNRFIAGAEKARLLYGAKIVFNQMHYAEIDSVNNRFFEVNGSGAFQLSDYRPILHDLLPIDPELVSFRSIDEGIAKIKYYLSHPDERYSIASEVYQYFVKKYTYDNLVEYLLENTFN